MANIVVISLDDAVDRSVSTINSNFAALNTALGSHTHAPSDLTSGRAAWGQILTWNGSAWAPSSVMVVGSGMVGIGTDTPTAKLTVVPDGDGQLGIQVLCPSNRNKYLTIIPESSSGTCILGYWAGSAWGNVYLGGSMWSDSQIGAAQAVLEGSKAVTAQIAQSVTAVAEPTAAQ